MKVPVCLKSTLRQPVRTLALLLLCSVAGFAFFSQVLQAVVVNRAVEKIGNYYQAIGTFQVIDDCTVDLSQLEDAIADSAYVDFLSIPRNVSATAAEISSADIYGNIFDNSLMYLYGTVDATDVGPCNFSPVLQYTRGLDQTDDTYTELGNPYQLTVRLTNLHWLEALSEHKEAAMSGRDELICVYYSESQSQLEQMQREISVSSQILCKLQFTYAGNGKGYNQMEPLDERGTLFLPLDESERPDLEAPEYAEILDGLELLKANHRSFYLTTTKDMTAMPEIEKHYTLLKGRFLNREDWEQGKRVCVIRRELAEIRNLSIGDPISLTLRNAAAGYFSLRDWPDRPWREVDAQQVTYEVVGIVEPNDLSAVQLQLSCLYNQIIVPDSTVPAEFGKNPHQRWMEEASVKLLDIRDKDKFLKETEPVLQKLGIAIQFLPTGWENFAQNALPIVHSAQFSAALFALILLCVLLLTALTYGAFRRKELAYLRALGMKKKQVVRQGFVPLALIYAIGVGASGVLAYGYGNAEAEKTLGSLHAEITLSADFSPLWMAVLALAVLAAAGIILWIYLECMSRRPVLEQLQGKQVKGTAYGEKEGKAQAGDRMSVTVKKTGNFEAEDSYPAQTGYGWIPRWLWKRLTRQSWKVLLTMAVAGGLLVGLSYLQASIQQSQASIDRLYETVEVTGEIIPGTDAQINLLGGFMDMNADQMIVSSPMISNYIREAVTQCDVVNIQDVIGYEKAQKVGRPATPPKYTKMNVMAVERPETLLAMADEEFYFVFEDGMTQDDFFRGDEQELQVMMETSAAIEIGIVMGDSIEIARGMTKNTYQVVGFFQGAADNADIMMGYSAAKKSGLQFRISRFEFAIDSAKNRELSQFKKELQETPLSGSLVKLYDEELTNAIEPLERNIDLLQILYPVMELLTAVLAFGLSMLLTLQSAKASALLRVLGVQRTQAEALLLLEQLVAALLGIILGIILTYAIPGLSQKDWLLHGGIYFIGTLSGGTLTSLFRIYRNPLALLQVKE